MIDCKQHSQSLDALSGPANNPTGLEQWDYWGNGVRGEERAVASMTVGSLVGLFGSTAYDWWQLNRQSDSWNDQNPACDLMTVVMGWEAERQLLAGFAGTAAIRKVAECRKRHLVEFVRRLGTSHCLGLRSQNSCTYIGNVVKREEAEAFIVRLLFQAC